MGSIPGLLVFLCIVIIDNNRDCKLNGEIDRDLPYSYLYRVRKKGGHLDGRGHFLMINR